MTDKQQIEEIAKVLEDRIINKTWRAEKVAKEIYEMIIPKDSVVLSRGEYHDLKGLEKKFDDYLMKEIKETRKETAEKILKEIGNIKLESYTGGEMILAFKITEKIKEFENQFGVEVDK